jgi:hypothetical protein
LRCPCRRSRRRRTPEGGSSAPSGLNSVPTAGPRRSIEVPADESAVLTMIASSAGRTG